MSKLAIKGHATRGKEVIEILETLGGKQGYEICTGSDTGYHWYIKDNGLITCNYSAYKNDCVEYTLEEFIEKYPYKVGDKVNYVKYNDEDSSVYTIQGMQWTGATIEYLLDSSGFSALTKDLLPYKEETMEDNIIDTVKENDNRYRIVLNHQFDMEVDEGEYYAVRRKPQYPKTYEECCKMLNIISNNELVFSNPNEESEYAYRNKSLYNAFDRLKICRDAYWKIAGEQMGLGKPWEPNWNNNTDKYVIITYKNCVVSDILWNSNALLAFPTTEMRDTFLENFKELIESVKELL